MLRRSKCGKEDCARVWILRTGPRRPGRLSAVGLRTERGDKVHRGMMRMRPPGFPLIPLLFPLGVFLSLMGLTTWYSYLSYRELDAIRRAEESGHTRQ